MSALFRFQLNLIDVFSVSIGIDRPPNRPYDERVPRIPVADLAKAYAMSETKVEKALMAIRRRVEAKRVSEVA